MPALSHILLFAVLSMLTGCSPAIGPTYRGDIAVRTGRIAVLGDTQRTLAVERIIGREQNDAERPLLIAGIVADQPDLLVHLGDAVANGASASGWRYFDQLMSPIYSAAIPVLPVVGNHDYWGFRSVAMANLHSRFPTTADSHWYSARYANLLLIWLDSNQQVLSREQWEKQAHWLRDQLNAADHNQSVRAVIVFCHHPPYTNSTVTTDDPAVQKAFVTPILQSRKAIALICGHTHAYEHFEVEGKTFLVSGGGGGPRPKLLQGEKQRHPDVFTGPSPRPFHFLLLRPSEHGVEVEVRGFDKGETSIRTIDRFTIAYGG